MKLSVVIVNYNVCDLLLSAVGSLYVAMDGIDGEIIVVDNASTDGAVEALNRLYPGVVTIPLDRNLGFGAANNIGIERSSGEYVLLLNPDTIVQEDTLTVMLDFMESHPEATFAGCKIILPDGSLDPVSKRGFPSPWSSFCRVFGLSRLFPRSKFFGGYNLTYIDSEQIASIDALAGCFMFCRSGELKGLGGFDTDFFMYGEDLDLCYRAKQGGGTIYYVPTTAILHRKGESTRRSSIDALAVFYEAMEIFARKHFRSNPPLLLLVRLGIWIRRALARVVERLPGLGFAAVDIPAAVTGFVLGSTIKFGSPFNYPDWAMLTVWCIPPLVIVAALAISGGYGRDDRTPSKALLGFLLGFFVLSTLTYFFKEYAFGRGIVLVTTGVASVVGVASRFLWLLYRRTYGAESIRRVAFLSRQEIGPGVRATVRRMFFSRPVVVVGGIAPTFSEVAALGGTALGTVENIAKIVKGNRLTDIVVLDSMLSYTEVLRAMGLTSSQPVRFHVLHGALEGSGEWVAPPDTIGSAFQEHRGDAPLGKRLRDRLLALLALIPGLPVVYWVSRSPAAMLRGLWDVVCGRRLLVGSGGTQGYRSRAPLFSMESLNREEILNQRELAQLENFYRVNQSFLLDCEIIISILRLQGLSRSPEALSVMKQSN